MLKQVNGPLTEKVGVVGCIFLNPVPIAREQALLAVARGLQPAEATMIDPAILDVEKTIVFHMLEAAKGFQTLIYENPDAAEYTDWELVRNRLLSWCEQILPPRPNYGGENVAPISNHPRYRWAG